MVQSIFLLPRYLERNHELISKSLAKHSISDEDLKAFEEAETTAKENDDHQLDNSDNEQFKKTN